MFETTHWLSRPDAELAFHHQAAEGSARGVLLALHGLAEHSRRYARFAQVMAAGGYHVYVPDHRGHGETKAADAPLGRFARRDGHRAVLSDIAAFRGHLGQRHPDLPVLLFGHSMGGMLALAAAIAAPMDYRALAIWNSGFGPPAARRAADLILRIEQALKGSDVPSLAITRLTFDRWAAAIPRAKTRFDWLSSDPARVAAYLADPLCGFDPSVSLWRDVMKLAAISEPDAALRRLPPALPIHLLGGDQDPSTEKGEALRRFAARLRRLGMRRVSCRIVPDMRHETLQEFGAEAEIAAFQQWCESALSGMTTPGAFGDPH